nr:hypothetical protein CFP56_58835 [Quercus suber]
MPWRLAAGATKRHIPAAHALYGAHESAFHVYIDGVCRYEEGKWSRLVIASLSSMKPYVAGFSGTRMNDPEV